MATTSSPLCSVSARKPLGPLCARACGLVIVLAAFLSSSCLRVLCCTHCQRVHHSIDSIRRRLRSISICPLCAHNTHILAKSFEDLDHRALSSSLFCSHFADRFSVSFSPFSCTGHSEQLLPLRQWRNSFRPLAKEER